MDRIKIRMEALQAASRVVAGNYSYGIKYEDADGNDEDDDVTVIDLAKQFEKYIRTGD